MRTIDVLIRLLFPFLLLALGCARQPRERPPEAPRLIVLLVADQFAYDYLERFEPVIEGGLRRLLDSGVSFREIHHEHAITATAPGHATLATGLFPRHHGVVGNSRYDEKGVSLPWVEGDDGEPSPHALLGPGLGDWLKGYDGESKVYTVSAKDRAAVFMGGRLADGAYWYDDETGDFVTTAYYGSRASAWLSEFHRKHHVSRDYGWVWTSPDVDDELLETLGVEAPDLGPVAGSFPHALGSPNPAPQQGFFEAVYNTPLVDDYVLRLAEAIIEGERLGADQHPDFLAISFSALDKVGHRYGPSSPEALDTVMRIDGLVARLLELLDREVGLDRTVVAFTGDHGVLPIPEVEAKVGGTARRIDASGVGCVQGLEAALGSALGEAHWLAPGPRIRPEALAASGVTREQVEELSREVLETCPGVARVWTESELAPVASLEDPDPMARMFSRSFHPERSPDFLIQFDERVLPTLYSETSHGSPYRYDTHVPLLVLTPGGRVGVEIEERVLTVDVAPTLASLALIPLPSGLDGVDRSSLILEPQRDAPIRP